MKFLKLPLKIDFKKGSNSIVFINQIIKVQTVSQPVLSLLILKNFNTYNLRITKK